MSVYQDSLTSCCAQPSRPRTATGIAGLFERALGYLRHRAELRRNRQAFLNQASLDDRILEDIGLDRRDVEEAADLPLEVNASLAVRDIAARRRAGERRMRQR